MSTTIPQQFTGIPSLSEAKVETIKHWYLEALGDEDKSSDGLESIFYEGQRMAFESVLMLLHGMSVPEPPDPAVGVVAWGVIEGPIGLDGRSTRKGA